MVFCERESQNKDNGQKYLKNIDKKSIIKRFVDFIIHECPKYVFWSEDASFQATRSIAYAMHI